MKIRLLKVVGIVWMALGLAAGAAAAGQHAAASSQKTGILLVAFGTSAPEAQVSFDDIEAAVQQRYAGTPVRWAYTSHIIRRKLAARGRHLDSPATALAKMQDEGFTRVVVQSLHTIGGIEYHDLERTVTAFRSMGGFQRIELGDPLMTTQEDMRRIVDAVLEMIPPRRGADEAVVLMGHGTPDPANAFYAALMFQLQLKDPLIFVGTVEGYPRIDLLVKLMNRRKIKKAWLLPFMSVAGDHARNDMAGDGDDSWKSVLGRAGIQAVPVLKGTAEYDGFVKIWVDHIQDAMNRF
jgi:sirohydrochlorin cobaltochelatase